MNLTARPELAQTFRFPIKVYGVETTPYFSRVLFVRSQRNAKKTRMLYFYFFFITKRPKPLPLQMYNTVKLNFQVTVTRRHSIVVQYYGKHFIFSHK